ncbi:MAG TPA: SIR2 family protein [Anaerolineae bacterium]|nr:SIR2 family protein [Anaerolineae bacterium]
MLDNKLSLRDIADQINDIGCTPVISNQLVLDMLFGKYNVAKTWAKAVEFPFRDSHILSRVAQYVRVETRPDVAKRIYLNFLKNHLLELERQKPNADLTFLDGVEKQLNRLNFTELACDHLKCINFDHDPPDNPFTVLATLRVPVYITTSHHLFIEKALTAVGKEPKIEVYRWNDFMNVPEEYKVDLKYEPTIDKPLVYHLHGIESNSASIVLTEDDHLDFLIRISRDFNKPDVTPPSVGTQIATKILLLVGYELGYDAPGWALQTVLKGLIEETQLNPRHPLSIAIQIDSTENDISNVDSQKWRKYLQSFFRTVQIEVFWDSTERFLAALWRELQ